MCGYIRIAIIYLIFSGVEGLEQNADTPIILAVAGEEAVIPCNVSTPLKDDEASLILWYRLDRPNPIYTLDIRNVPMPNARHFPSTDMEERLHFDIDVHPPVLILSPTVPEDEADYKCRVDLRRSRTLILQTRLKIIVPPDDPIIMDEHGQRLVDIIGPYDEGTTIIFICDVDGGDPTPSVTWWKEDYLVDRDFNVTKRGFVRNELVLPEINRVDLMANYSCRASNTNLTSPKVSAVQLDMNLLPLDIDIEDIDIPWLAGEEYVIKCVVTGSKPAAISTWWLDNQKITIGIHELLNETNYITENYLTFSPTVEEDGRVLTCKAANPAISKSTIQTSILLQINYFPILNLVLSSSSNESIITEGSVVFLHCRVKANPWIFNVSWEFQQNILQPNTSSGVIIGNQTLWLKKARKEYNGTYRCWASNDIGRASSNYLHLIIHYVPVCNSHYPVIHAVSLNEFVNVSCDTDSHPPVHSYKWALNNSRQVVILRDWSTDIAYRILRYSPTTESGYGTLFCWSRNNLGIQKLPCSFRIVIASVPEPPQECVQANQTMHLIYVICKSGYNGGLQQTFHLEVYNSRTELLERNLTEGNKPVFEIDSLHPSTSYLLIIYALNSKGKSKSVLLVVTTAMAERRTAEENIPDTNLIVALLFGSGAIFFVIIATIVFIIISQRNRKNSTKQESANQCEEMKKDMEESPDPGEKGPDIIPLSAEPDVFFLSGKIDEISSTSKMDSPSTTYVLHHFKHTAL